MLIDRRIFSVVLLCMACGGKQPAAEEPRAQAGSGAEREESASDGLAVTGLKGTLSQDEVKNALEPRMPKFARCVAKRSGEVEWLSGSLQMSFRVAVDGSVASVFPLASTMGDRDTERCAVDVAKATHFPAPHGGEAEFTWSFEVPLDSEVRPPLDWTDSEVGAELTAHASEVMAQCGNGQYGITAYVDTDGKVVSAGAATASEDAAAQLDCVVEAVRSWSFTSPGSYAAKAQFSIQ
jgi:outer membrane biosynthesis protein TonB